MCASLLEAPRRPDPLGWAAPPRPRLRPVRRPRLVAALAADAAPYVVLVAPAGYGKTTLLHQWCALDRRPWAWVTLERRHDDPLLLLRAIARAVDEAGAGAPIVLVLDDVQAVRSRAARETLAEIVKHPPEGMSMVLASRTELPLPVARLRAQNLVTELRGPELEMTRVEAAELFHAGGLTVDGERLDELMHRTEGWPVALSLAAQALRREGGGALRRSDGGDRAIAEFLRDEVLAGLDASEREFASRTAILDELIAPLCDAVAGGPGSAAMLARLQHSGFPLVTLDRRGERHRHHRLLANLLLGELRRTAPGLEADLHRRASDWHAGAGELEPAVRHALAAGDATRAGDLAWAGAPDALERGEMATLQRRLALFTSAQIASHHRLALLAAATCLADGAGDQAECWIRAAAGTGGGVAALRAAVDRGELAGVQAGAERASALLGPDSPGQALCRLLSGAAVHLRGEPGAARAVLEEGARRAAVRAPLLQALCLAQLALVALDEHDAEAAARHAARARAQVERHGLERAAVSALVLAASALVRAGRAREEAAARDLRAAAELSERLIDIAPWFELEVTVVLARAALRLGDARAAGAHLSRARTLAGRVPDAIVLGAWLQAAEALAGHFEVSGPRAALTPAELRTLRFLPTHLAFREIGERTGVTANTVKTQVNSLYRKLGVGSRSDAVGRAQALGILEAS